MNLQFRRVRQKRKAHPLVKQLIDKMNEQGVGVVEMCREAGVARNAFGLWGRIQSPRVETLEACLNVLGYRLAVERVPGEKLHLPRRHIHYLFTSPTGEQFMSFSIKPFCQEHGLSADSMYDVASGQRGSCHGWKVEKVLP